jgi:hypothetical protein
MSSHVLRETIQTDVNKNGFAVVQGTDFEPLKFGDAWHELSKDWMRLEIDAYMADHGQYRLRRYGRFFFRPITAELKRLPHAAVFQSQNINNFAGGIHRDFAPLLDDTFRNTCLLALIRFDFDCFGVRDAALLHEPWEIWIHQIRIRASGNKEVRPAPEGIHHDGHDFIAMHLVRRENVAGGLSLLYDNEQEPLHSCLLEEPLDTIYADDRRVMHAVAPIRAVDEAGAAYRDILIIDFDHRPNLTSPA